MANFELLFQCHRKQPSFQDALQPQGQGCYATFELLPLAPNPLLSIWNRWLRAKFAG
jgi:hypothetical protein